MRHVSTKTYGHETGLSCCFRQWRAASHCMLLHGYALSIRLEFSAEELDERNWVIDFGGLKGLKAWLVGKFDHTTLVARDDPKLEWFQEGARMGVLQLVLVDAVGCEATARLIYEEATAWLDVNGHSPRVRLDCVEVSEHGANSAKYVRSIADETGDRVMDVARALAQTNRRAS